MTNGHTGRSSKLYPVTGDLEKTRDKKLPAVDPSAISAAGYAVDSKQGSQQAKTRQAQARLVKRGF
jgi:hypothetical protein